MSKVPRHKFVPEADQEEAYIDIAMPIGYGQTISQPYIVALMTELLELKYSDKVLEIGTGSGYQTAVLAELVQKLFTVELIPELSAKANSLLNSLGYTNISYRIGDGKKGWKEEAPFDAIIVTAAPKNFPPDLTEQLKDGGRMVIPASRKAFFSAAAHGSKAPFSHNEHSKDLQILWKLVKKDGVIHKTDAGAVRFVPLV